MGEKNLWLAVNFQIRNKKGQKKKNWNDVFKVMKEKKQAR